MANQENFRTDVSSESKKYAKYTVSRIIEKLSDDLLTIEAPADFPVNLNGYNVEINIYSLEDNSLIFSTTVSNETTPNVLITQTLVYDDNTGRNLLFIDFSKLTGINFPVGQISATFNFFKNEVGSATEQILKVTDISTTRQEVELELTDITKREEFEKFAIPYISAEYVQNALKQAFNQPNSADLVTYTTSSQLNRPTIASELGETIAIDLVNYGFDTGSINFPGVYQLAQQVLDNAYFTVSNTVARDIQTLTGSFTNVYLNNIISNAIRVEYQKVVNRQQYRFILL
jgi:hypothetical protein